MDIIKLKKVLNSKSVPEINRLLDTTYNIMEDISVVKRSIVDEVCNELSFKVCDDISEQVESIVSESTVNDELSDLLLTYGYFTVQKKVIKEEKNEEIEIEKEEEPVNKEEPKQELDKEKPNSEDEKKYRHTTEVKLTGTLATIRDTIKVLRTMESLGSAGASRHIEVFVDGDGAFRLKLDVMKEFDVSLKEASKNTMDDDKIVIDMETC